MLDDVATYLVLAPIATVALPLAALIGWRSLRPRLAAVRRTPRRQFLA